MLGKPGGPAAAFSDALGRMISLPEKHRTSPAETVRQLRAIHNGHPAGVGPSAVLSVPDGVVKAMAEHYPAERVESVEEPSLPIVGPCPDCGASLEQESGCTVCRSCGYSRCS